MDQSEIFPRGGNGYRFDLSEYECSWLDASERSDDGEMVGKGGFVCVRVAYTGDDTQDWLESDVTASTTERAIDIARGLIAEHEDAQLDHACVAPVDPLPDADGTHGDVYAPANAVPVCGKPATTERTVEDIVCPLCEEHAAELDRENAN